ncbi:MAG: TetR/AcrR family transcriptional regulator C-terminal domain-containing protein, partial [Clostridia bacterium]|nr:TetR/AcrR family transcriptional regulator C-terminal domain-containing protein [Clostridia bacterium]
MSNPVKADLTKRALAESLKKLMVTKPVKKISIREITEDCGINRQTFYYHFQDIYELIEWTIREELFSILSDSDRFLSWQDAGIFVLRYIRDNEALALCLINTVNHETLRHYLHKDIFNIASLFLRYAGEGISVSEEDFRFLSNFYVISFIALLEEWMHQGMKRSPEELIHKLEIIIGG